MHLCDRTLTALLMLGSTLVWTRASGQGFHRRYDLLGQHNWEAGWDIEMNPSGYVIIGNMAAFTNDGGFYEPIVFSLLLDADGTPAGGDTVVVTNHALYPGTWGCMRRRLGGGYVSGGSTLSQSLTQRFALYKVALDGHIQLVGQYGPEGEEMLGRQAIECKDGGFLMVGETGEFGVIDGMLIKTDSAGVVQWERNYGGPMRDYFWAADTTMNEDIVVVGARRFEESNVEWWALRLSSEGDTVWARTWGSEYSDLIPDMTTKRDGNLLFSSGWKHDQDAAFSRLYQAELDQDNGEVIWQHEYGPVLEFAILRVAKEIAADQGHIATGMAFAENTNFFQGILLRTADNGDSLWMRRYFYYDSLMTDGLGELYDVLPTPDGGFIACGFVMGPYGGSYPPGYSDDLWVVKVDSMGCIIPGCDIPMGITSQITNMGYALNVYPNPLRRAQGDNQLHVAITLPANFKTEGPLALTVVSMEGKLVRQEVVPTSAPNELILDVTGLAPGAYTVHLSDAHTWIAGKKFIIE